MFDHPRKNLERWDVPHTIRPIQSRCVPIMPARVLAVVLLLLALLPAGLATASDDGSFLSPLAYWGLDDGAATVTEEDGAWSASLRVEKLDSRSALDEYAIFLVGTYPFILSDTSF